MLKWQDLIHSNIWVSHQLLDRVPMEIILCCQEGFLKSPVEWCKEGFTPNLEVIVVMWICRVSVAIIQTRAIKTTSSCIINQNRSFIILCIWADRTPILKLSKLRYLINIAKVSKISYLQCLKLSKLKLNCRQSHQ